VTIHLDTSAVIGSLTEPQASLDHLVSLVENGHRLLLSSIVLYEWLRGPRTPAELLFQEELFPRAAAVPFDAEAAVEAARLYTAVNCPRGREVDLAIAAAALSCGAALWTLNESDFRDIPGLQLV